MASFSAQQKRFKNSNSQAFHKNISYFWVEYKTNLSKARGVLKKHRHGLYRNLYCLNALDTLEKKIVKIQIQIFQKVWKTFQRGNEKTSLLDNSYVNSETIRNERRDPSPKFDM